MNLKANIGFIRKCAKRCKWTPIIWNLFQLIQSLTYSTQDWFLRVALEEMLILWDWIWGRRNLENNKKGRGQKEKRFYQNRGQSQLVPLEVIFKIDAKWKRIMSYPNKTYPKSPTTIWKKATSKTNQGTKTQTSGKKVICHHFGKIQARVKRS